MHMDTQDIKMSLYVSDKDTCSSFIKQYQKIKYKIYPTAEDYVKNMKIFLEDYTFKTNDLITKNGDDFFLSFENTY